MKIYIAGQYNPRVEDDHLAIRKAKLNVDKAIKAFVDLKEKGHIPFVPHLSHYIHTNQYADEYGEWWYKYDFSFLKEWADAILLLDNWEESEGAKKEFELAKDLGLNVYKNIEDIPRGDEI